MQKGIDEMDREIFARNLEKWRELPIGGGNGLRAFSSEILQWPDGRLLAQWRTARDYAMKEAAWYLKYYEPIFRGRDVCEVGPGIGLDGIWFAERGARMTFADIVPDNLRLLRRICGLQGICAEFYEINNPLKFDLAQNFDAFLMVGIVHHSPFDFMRRELRAMMKFLNPGGRVAVMAYPKERYVKSRAEDFTEFARMTDGVRTPWAEWYDDAKIRRLFGRRFELNWSRNFNDDKFAWFDLTKKGGQDVV
uniref:Putative methyltransferase n=1 Tax=viral metagenome TaxID=1070528 RepID=A0A6M3KFD3_9ZZZZ